MLDGASERQHRVLSAFRTQRNIAVLHSDPGLMPRRRLAWSSWNYLAETHGADAQSADVSVTYWMNRLQGLVTRTPLLVSLNPLREPARDLTHARFDYDHPVFDAATLQAQAQLGSIQGEGGVYFCGAWCGHGFHEDGLASGLAVAERLGVRRPWAREEPRVASGSAPIIPERAAAGPGD
jgi:predicted NAD/FAD-binding protein